MITVNGEAFIGAWRVNNHMFSVAEDTTTCHPLFDTKWGRHAEHVKTEDGYDVYRVQKAYTIK